MTDGPQPRRWRVLNMADTTACPDVFGPLGNLAEVVSLPPDQNVLRESLPGFDVYFASLHVRLDADALRAAQRLRVIATPSTGLDHVDLKAAGERGIAVLSLKDDTAFLERITATAELAWALLLAVVRRLPWAFAAAREGRWARDEFRGQQLSGKTLGILGYGRLGRMVARFGLAFGMRVIACDIRDVRPDDGVTMVDRDELLRESDVLSVHVHLTEDNRRLLDAEAFARMRRGAVLINTSRGGVIDEATLVEALRSGRLGGAGVDVVDGEWDENLRSHPLIRYANEHDNLVITPHVGGVTHESQRMAFEHTVAKLLHYMEGLDGQAGNPGLGPRRRPGSGDRQRRTAGDGMRGRGCGGGARGR
jgi:D-3-phosphoglycerate dehydrogenase